MSAVAISGARRIVVPISGVTVSGDRARYLVTYSLGSCVAVCVYDPDLQVAGMVHFMLPHSRLDRVRAQSEPGMFGDTGVPLLFRKMYEQGCRRENLVVKVVGGGVMLDAESVFDIGRQNAEIAINLLARNCIPIAAMDVGESRSRTVKMSVRTGRTVVLSQGEEQTL